MVEGMSIDNHNCYVELLIYCARKISKRFGNCSASPVSDDEVEGGMAEFEKEEKVGFVMRRREGLYFIVMVMVVGR